MDPCSISQNPPITIIGIECLTSNAPEAEPLDIPKHWKKFHLEKAIEQIPNKLSKDIIALYCDYEGDFTQPYSFVLGVK